MILKSIQFIPVTKIRVITKSRGTLNFGMSKFNIFLNISENFELLSKFLLKKVFKYVFGTKIYILRKF